MGTLQTVAVERRGPVAWVTLDRPERHNAQTIQMWAELTELGATLVSDPTLRCAVVTGRGASFSSGLDLSEVTRGSLTSTEPKSVGSAVRGVTSWLGDAPFPTIACVRGHCYGAGLQIALGADLRVASTTARFASMETRYGLVPDMGAVEWLPRIVGMGRAKELIYLAEVIDAAEAHRIGLVNRVVEDSELEGATEALAEKLAASPPLSLRHAKQLIHRAYDEPGTAIAASRSAQHTCLGSADFAETAKAMAENRPPAYIGA